VAEIHKIHGLKELEDNLLLLGRDIHARGVRLMMSRAAVPMREEAKQRVPVLKVPDVRRIAGTIKKQIAIWRKRQTPYAVTYYVGVRGLSKKAIREFKQTQSQSGKRATSSNNPNDPFYWRFIEFGTSQMRAQPFLRPAFETKKNESVMVALKTGQDFIRRTIKRFKKLKK
jgi:HK97 gp10 family phage protein